MLKKLLFFLLAELAIGIFIFFNNPFIKEKPAEEPLSFNPVLLEWQQVESEIPWEPRDSHAVAVFRDKLWLMGGLNADDFVIEENVVEYWKAPYFSDVWSSEDGINWELVQDKAPWGKRRSMAVTSFHDKLWLMGGWGPDIGYQNDIWYSENGVDWTKAVSQAAWPAREGHLVINFKDKLWLVGGVDYDKRQTMNDVWYSEDGLNWIEATSSAPWQPRWDHALAVFKGKLWLIGGMDLRDNVFRDIWSSEDGINWKLVRDDPPWQTRQGHQVLVYKNRMWLIGRLNDKENGGVNDVWFSEDGFIWKKTNTDPEWLGREDAAAAVFQDKMWLLGGMDKNWRWRNDVWYSKPYVPVRTVAKTSYPVKTSLWQKMAASMAQSFNLSDKRVEVNLAEQKMRTFEDEKIIDEFIVSTGREDMPTPEGNFVVSSKSVMVYSNLADCWLPFWVGFTSDGLYGFHEVPICPQGRKGTEDLGKPASIGCVRMGVGDSETFYKWVDIGTNIKIYNKPAVEKNRSEENIESENPDYFEEKPKWFDELRNRFLNIFK